MHALAGVAVALHTRDSASGDLQLERWREPEALDPTKPSAGEGEPAGGAWALATAHSLGACDATLAAPPAAYAADGSLAALGGGAGASDVALLCGPRLEVRKQGCVFALCMKPHSLAYTCVTAIQHEVHLQGWLIMCLPMA